MLNRRGGFVFRSPSPLFEIALVLVCFDDVPKPLRVLCESRKLFEQREMQLKQLGQFLEQRATIADEILGDTAIRARPL